MLTVSCGHENPLKSVDPFGTGTDPLGDWTLPVLLDSAAILTVPTYDGSGQSVHPDVVLFPDGWRGSKYWMTMTPYPFGASYMENPSVLQSNDGIGLAIPQGVINPIIAPVSGMGYNSDPDLIYDAAQDELVMSYRQVAAGYNSIYITTSKDGSSWTSPHMAFREVNHSAVSQSIVPAYKSIPAIAWYVDAGAAGCSATSAKIMTRSASAAPVSLAAAQWSAPMATDLRIPGYVPWHLKVSYIPSKREYWALVVAFPADGLGCGADDLFLAHSRNGVHWETFRSPLMKHQDHWWSKGALYRGTFLYDETSDQLAVWFSARAEDDVWRMLFMRMNYSSLSVKLSQAPPSLSTSPDSNAAKRREVWTTAP
jgi:hypothetical protein